MAVFLNRVRLPLAFIFRRIHRKNLWGSVESVSGRGSTLERTEAIRTELPAILRKLGIRTLLDVGCGDFNWMSRVDLGEVRYTGLDIVRPIVLRNQKMYGNSYISFAECDVTRGPLPETDAVLCRDALDHLSLSDASRAIATIRKSGAAYLLATTHSSGKNTDIRSGHWRPLDLTKPPFNFPTPIETIIENRERGKLLGVWALRDTRAN